MLYTYSLAWGGMLEVILLFELQGRGKWYYLCQVYINNK